jgi:hypothetical protein
MVKYGQQVGEGQWEGVGATWPAAVGRGRRSGRRGIQAAHPTKGGPVARGKGGALRSGGVVLGHSAGSGCIGPEHSSEEDFHGFYQVRGAVAIGEEPIVPDPHEAFGEHVEEKPTDEFLGREALVADGDPVGPSTCLEPPKARLGVDHPVLDPELREERAEGGRRCERGGLSGEVELSRLGLSQHLVLFPREHHGAQVWSTIVIPISPPSHLGSRPKRCKASEAA